MDGSLNRERVERVVRFRGMLAIGILAVLVPGIYFSLSVRGLAAETGAEARFLAHEVETIIHDRPELWPYETLRLREIAARSPLGEGRAARSIVESSGRQLVHSGDRPPWPVLRQEVPIFDSGVEVARLVSDRSLRPVVQRTLALAALCILGALAGLMVLRALPIRFIDSLIDELQSERTKSAGILASIRDCVVAVDADGRVLHLNQAAAELLGRDRAASIGQPIEQVYRPLAAASDGGPSRIRYSDGIGPVRILEERSFEFHLPKTERPGRVVLFRDISERIEAEAELLRARQIESLGVLAGGIAHDFNNFLAAILGNVTLARDLAGRGSKVEQRLEVAIQATERARQTALRLMAFAKGGEPSRAVLDLAVLAQEAAGFVLQGSGAACEFRIEPGLWYVEGDAGLLSQALGNLVINAKQAMEDHGRMRIRLANRELDATNVPPPLFPGRFVVLTVEDSGPGVPEEIRDRIFEPYFTTKVQGSGLGLATAFKILRGHGGNLYTGRSFTLGGAAFSMYLPATDAQPVAAVPAALDAAAEDGGRILVMDDDPLILDTSRHILEHHGFAVSTASEGRRALQAWLDARSAGNPFRAAVLDLTVPGGMGGVETARQLLRADPDAALIASSGYSEDPVMAKPGEFGFVDALPKPYPAASLVAVVRRACRRAPQDRLLPGPIR